MADVAIKADGSVVFWTLAESFNRDKLNLGWTLLGLQDAVPEPRAAVSCLKDALVEVYHRRDILIRPLAAKNGFVVKAETRGEDDNDYATELTVKLTEDNKGLIFTGNPEKQNDIRVAYFKMLGQLTAPQVALGLVKVLNSISATRLRPTGGVYWVRGERLERWKEAMKVVESSAEVGNAVGYSIKHNFDQDSIKAVQDAIIHEVTSEANQLQAEICSGELGDRAIKTRRNQASSLRHKVAEYEKILDVQLTALRETLDKVEGAQAMATLIAGFDTNAPVLENINAI